MHSPPRDGVRRRRGAGAGQGLRALGAQHAQVAVAARDALGVEVLQQRDGVLARGSHGVAQLGSRGAPLGAQQRDGRLLERLVGARVEGELAAHAPDAPGLLERAERAVRNGSDVTAPQGTPDGTCRVYAQNGEFLMLGEVKDGVLHTIKSFFEV